MRVLGTMRIRRAAAVLILAASTGLAGCQTSAIDALETTSISSGLPRGYEADIAAGKSHFRQANYGLAEQHFRKVVETKSDSAEGWMGLAASYDQLGRFDFADRAYDQLLKVAGRRPEIVNNLGYSHYLRGDKARARELYLEARQGMADPTVVDANLALL
jgi:Flp pilus assembly protein TadD